jgi:hypothetical protein
MANLCALATFLRPLADVIGVGYGAQPSVAMLLCLSLQCADVGALIGIGCLG